MTKALALAATLLVPLLAGCAEPAPEPGAAATAPPEQAARFFAAPTWEVGQAWDHKWSLYSNGNVTLEFVARSIVAEDNGDSWTLATDNQTIAAYHGAFTFPTLGRFSKSGLTATAEESTWPWYRFPFQVNDTWQDKVVTFDGVETTTEVPVDVRVLDAATIGGTPGHPIIEMRSGGKPYARYDYDERSGWFSDALFFGHDGQLQFRVQRLAKSEGFTGPAYDSKGSLVVGSTMVVAVGTTPEGAPLTLFDVPADHTHLLAFVFAFAFTGAQDAELFDPQQTRYGVQAADVNGQTIVNDSRQLLVPAVAGQWRFQTAGAGVASGGGIQAWAIQERVIEV